MNYRGSIASFYYSRQAVGVYKCCVNVYNAPTRGYNFDVQIVTAPVTDGSLSSCPPAEAAAIPT